MRAIPRLLTALLMLSAPLLLTPPAALAQPRHTAAPAKPHSGPVPPKAIGSFADWEAATHQEGGQTVCYAFTRALAPAGGPKSESILTVTERPSGRDAVAITTNFTFAPNAAVTVAVEQTNLDFYTAQRAAFARDGRAAIAAFLKGRQAVAHEPGPRSGALTDNFSLRGFDQAYAAINKACPAK